MALADYQLLVDSMVSDQSGQITSAVRDQAIDVARLRYGSDLPRDLVEDVTWPGTGYYAPLPTTWVDGSQLSEAEYPIGVVPIALIDLALYVDGSGTQLMAAYSLDAGALVRVRFTAPQLLDATHDTIPLQHREPVASYAAHLLCRQLATYYSGERETSIGADGSNTESRARNYAARAKEYRAAYYGGIGKADPQAAAAAGGTDGVLTGAAQVGSWPGRCRYRLTWQNRGGL